MDTFDHRNPLAFSEGKNQPERRRHGRLRCDELSCNIGQIRDLSASGMQVFRRGGRITAVGSQMTIVIEYLESTMEVDVNTVRVDHLGFRKHLYGFEFINLDDDQKARLTALARIARDKLTLIDRK